MRLSSPCLEVPKPNQRHRCSGARGDVGKGGDLVELGWRSQTMQANRMMNAPWKVARADVRGGGPDVWGSLSQFQSAVSLLAEAGRTFYLSSFVPYGWLFYLCPSGGQRDPNPGVGGDDTAAVLIR